MKTSFLLITVAIWVSASAVAQRTIPPTDSLHIRGEVKNPTSFSLADLLAFPSTEINDQIIYNHNGEAKGSVTGMKGIPIKTLLASFEYIHDKPKELNEFYFVFSASDGYKVVFSWNEIYNTETGNHFFIVTEMDGKKLEQLDQRIVFISSADLKAGRRYIKGLEKIEVRRVE